MEKKFSLLSCLIGFVLLNASGQVNFHDKLHSIYKRNVVPLIYVEELKTLLKANEKITLLDIRALEEYNISHIATAHLMDYKNFHKEHLDTIDRHMPIVVYCSVGVRSERIGKKLLDMGFTDVRNLYGGIFEWKNLENTVVDAFGKSTERIHTYNKGWSQWVSKGAIVY